MTNTPMVKDNKEAEATSGHPGWNTDPRFYPGCTRVIHKTRYSTSTSKKTTRMSVCRKPFLCGTSVGFCSESEGVSVSPWLSNKNVRRVANFFIVLRRNEHFERTPGGRTLWVDRWACNEGSCSVQSVFDVWTGRETDLIGEAILSVSQEIFSNLAWRLWSV